MVAGHRHGRRVPCIGLDVVDAVFRHTVKSVYYLRSRSINDRRHSLKLTMKFRYGTFSTVILQDFHLALVMCIVVMFRF